MFCSNCGKKIENNNKFCTGCGKSIEVNNNSVQTNVGVINNQNINNVSTASVVKKTGVKGWIVGVICAVIVVSSCIGVWAFAKFNVDENKNNNNNVVNNDQMNSGKIDVVTDFKNYDIEIVMITEIAGMSVESVSTGVVDQVNQVEYLEVETTSLGMITVSNKIYYDYTSGYSYATRPYGGDVWWKEKGTSQVVDLNALLDKLMNMKDVTLVEENHYKVKVSINELKGMMSSQDVDLSKLLGGVMCDVYLEDGYVTKMEYDFSELVPGADKFTTTIKFSNYNEAGDVEIPQTIIDNAKENK